MMGYSRQVIVDLIKKRRLKASKLGSHRRIRLSDLLEYMNKEQKEAGEDVRPDSDVHTELDDED